VLHPKYRTIGLGAQLVKETLPKAGTKYVEAIAVMARYNLFFEKAEMKRIAEQKPDPSCQKAIEQLRKLGFNLILLASKKQNLRRLKELSREEMSQCKDILANVRLPRLWRAAVPEKPYTDNVTYRSAIEKAGIEKMARMLRVLSILMQTKVYLLWERAT